MPADGSTGFLDLRLKMNGGTQCRVGRRGASAKPRSGSRRIAADPTRRESIVAAPMIRIPKGVILPEALLDHRRRDRATARDGVARVTVGEVKVFPDRGGHTDPQQLATARAQAGVYRHALELAVAALGLADAIEVATDGFLVFTWPGSNSPSVRPSEDLTYQAIRAERGSSGWRRSRSRWSETTTSRRTTRRSSQRVLDADTDYSEACLVVLRPRAPLPPASARRRRPDRPRRRGEAAPRATPRSRAPSSCSTVPTPADDREADLQRQLAAS